MKKDSVECISSSTETKQTTIFYCKVNLDSTGVEDKETVTLNIMGVKRLIYALTCIKDDVVTLTINPNHILYNSNGTSFKFHLKEDGIIEKPVISIEKIEKMVCDFDAVVPLSRILDLLKGSNFCNADSNKIYLYIKDGVMYGEITDKSIQNLDTINVILTDKITGKMFDGAIPVTVDLFRLVSGIKTEEIKLKINTERKILLFEVQDDTVSLKYVASSLVQ